MPAVAVSILLKRELDPNKLTWHCVPVQVEQAVSDLRGGRAVRDGECFMAEETLTVGKVRHMCCLLSLKLTIRKGWNNFSSSGQVNPIHHRHITKRVGFSKLPHFKKSNISQWRVFHWDVNSVSEASLWWIYMLCYKVLCSEECHHF